MSRFLNKITFLDSSGQEITLDTSVINAHKTVPLRDNNNRFQVGDTDASSTDGYVVINKNYVDRNLTISSSFFNSLY